MSNPSRHLTLEERATLAALFDACGAPEVLRVVASLTANARHYDSVGDTARSRILAVAIMVDPQVNPV